MAGWGDLLGKGSVAEQLLVWGVLNQVIGDLFGPMEDLIRQKVNAAHPEVPLSPADLADMVVRGVRDQAAAATEAARSGIDPDRFDALVKLTGEPPGLEDVITMWRRGIIGWDDTGVSEPSVERAIKTSRVYNYWSGPIQKNAEVPITVGEAVDAYIRGQVERGYAEKEAKASGIDADRFAVLADAAGRPPSLTELLELKRRRLIPDRGLGPDVRSFQQGIAEGDTKNKWLDEYLALAVYVPPPRTVTALLKTGSISDAQAAAFYTDAGMTAELAAAYIHSARGEKLAGTKTLAEQAVITLYESRAMTAADARTHLAALGYDSTDVALVLELADLARELRVVNSAVTKVGALYVTHKITRAGALDALASLEVTREHAAHLLATWDTERTANVKELTPAQIAKAFKLGNLAEADAAAELMALGYTRRDAYVILWNEVDATGKTLPAQEPNQPGTVP